MEGSCKFGDKCRNEHAGWDVVERAEIADARFKPPTGNELSQYCALVSTVYGSDVARI